jgi:hypothetical protein
MKRNPRDVRLRGTPLWSDRSYKILADVRRSFSITGLNVNIRERIEYVPIAQIHIACRAGYFALWDIFLSFT